MKLFHTFSCVLLCLGGLAANQPASMLPAQPTLVAGTDAPICPATTYDLNRLVSGMTPEGSTLHFYTSDVPSTATLVADPTVAPAGTYYARYESSEGNGPVSQSISIADCQTPFVCKDGVAYQVAAEDEESLSSLYSFNVMSGVRTLVAPLSVKANALVYNPIDNMLWACKVGDTGTLVRIDATGALVEYKIANLSGRFNVGAMLPDGLMLVYEANSSSYYTIDINPARPTYLHLVDPATRTTVTNGKSISEAVNVADLVHRSTTGSVYGIETSTSRLISLDYATGVLTRGAPVLSLPRNTTFGAIFADTPDRLFAFDNGSHAFHRITLSTNVAYRVSTSVASNFNDGASCPYAMQEIIRTGCYDAAFLQVNVEPGDTVSRLYLAFTTQGDQKRLLGRLPARVSSLIYKTKDRMLWGTKSQSNVVVRIDREAGMSEFQVPDLPVQTYDAGVELPDGYMLVYASNSPSYYVIDIDQTRPTFLRLVDPTNGFAAKTGPEFGTRLSMPLDLGDIAFTPTAQLCYGINSRDGRLGAFNPFTGVATLSDAPVRGIKPGIYGSVFTDRTEKLFALRDDTGELYKIDPSVNTAYFMSTAPPAAGSDGANCPNALITTFDVDMPGPEVRAVCAGSPISLTATATGSEPFLFWWQVSTDGGKSWTELNRRGVTDDNGSYSGATTATLHLRPKTSSWNGNKYRVSIMSDETFEYGSLITPPVDLVINNVPESPTLKRTITRPLCPDTTADLTTLVTSTAPEGGTLEFYTTATPSSGTLVADPTKAASGAYYAFYTNPGCTGPSSEALTVDDECGTLPVKLAAFSVVKEGNSTAVLNWETTEESNSDYFGIERSGDMRSWTKIGEKQAYGESQSSKKYDFTDHVPASGINYYRLKMVDKDGTFAYSRVQYAAFDEDDTITAYPKPASDRLKFKNFAQVKELLFYNVMGVKVLELRAIQAEGADVSQLAPGIYSVSVMLKDGTITTQKVLIAR